MKIKVIFLINLLMLLAVFFHEIVFLKFDRKDSLVYSFQRKMEYYPFIRAGVDLYTKEETAKLKVDEYFLFNEVVSGKKIKTIDFSILKQKYANDPFKRLLNKNDYVPDVEIQKKNVIDAIGKPLEGNFYSINNADGSFGAWNDMIIKALYCDRSGFDVSDFFILKLMYKGDGGYYDTHYLFSLLFLKKNKCYAGDKIDEQIGKVSQDIIRAETEDKVFGDLYAERVVFLYWAGFGNSIKKEWVDLIKDNFTKDYGWEDKQKPVFNGHVSALSLLSLIYYSEGKNEQPFYVSK